MEIKLSKEDAQYLIDILEKDHFHVNAISVYKCPEVGCWYKKIIDKLKQIGNKETTKTNGVSK